MAYYTSWRTQKYYGKPADRNMKLAGEVADRLHAEAEANGRSEAEVVEAALNAYFGK